MAGKGGGLERPRYKGERPGLATEIPCSLTTPSSLQPYSSQAANAYLGGNALLVAPVAHEDVGVVVQEIKVGLRQGTRKKISEAKKKKRKVGRQT